MISILVALLVKNFRGRLLGADDFLREHEKSPSPFAAPKNCPQTIKRSICHWYQYAAVCAIVSYAQYENWVRNYFLNNCRYAPTITNANFFFGFHVLSSVSKNLTLPYRQKTDDVVRKRDSVGEGEANPAQKPDKTPRKHSQITASCRKLAESALPHRRPGVQVAAVRIAVRLDDLSFPGNSRGTARRRRFAAVIVDRARAHGEFRSAKQRPRS